VADIKQLPLRNKEFDFANSVIMLLLKNFIIKAFTTGFGLDYFSIAAGLIGILLGLVAAYSIHLLPFWIKLLITLGLIVIAIPLSSEAESIFQEKDSSKIIIDEVIGVLIATIWFNNLSIPFFF